MIRIMSTCHVRLNRGHWNRFCFLRDSGLFWASGRVTRFEDVLGIRGPKITQIGIVIRRREAGIFEIRLNQLKRIFG